MNKNRNPLALVAFIVGLIGSLIPLLGIVLGLVAIVLGAIALRDKEIGKNDKVFSIIGIVVGLVPIFWVLWFTPVSMETTGPVEINVVEINQSVEPLTP